MLSDAPDGLQRRRLNPQDRERMIVDEAVRFFAEHGFEGQTRELARRLGITQPLLYRYFPSKEDLIERVYEQVFSGRWQPEWEAWVSDPGAPLVDRLTRFYIDYADTIITREWFRIFMFFGLRGAGYNKRYLGRVREAILPAVCAGIRALLNLPPTTARPLAEAELELAWGLHASIVYMGIREFIYDMPVSTPRSATIRLEVETFVAGAATTWPRLVDPHPA